MVTVAGEKILSTKFHHPPMKNKATTVQMVISCHLFALGFASLNPATVPTGTPNFFSPVGQTKQVNDLQMFFLV